MANLNVGEIQSALNLPAFKARQIFRWLAKCCDFSEMSDQQKSLREELSSRFDAQGVRIVYAVDESIFKIYASACFFKIIFCRFDDG